LTSDDAIRIARTELERDAYKRALDAYQRSFDTGKWAIGIIFALFGYIIFRNTREYKDAVNDAKKSCEKAEHWEEKAMIICDKIDKLVKVKLDEIEQKGKDSIKSVVRETQEQMKISELWNAALMSSTEGKYEDACEKYARIVMIKPDMHEVWYNWGTTLLAQAEKKEGAEADRLFKESYEKYQKAVEIKPDMHEAWNNWGNALLAQAEKKEGAEADRLFKESYEKYQKAVEIKPDMHEAWNNWGTALLAQAKKKEGDEKEKLLREAREKYLNAERKDAYNLACIAAIEGNEEECRKWLKVGEEAGSLPTREYAMSDEDLRPYWDKDWFKEIRWCEEK
jgi:tetratricopeptide (TPR) repeat protein